MMPVVHERLLARLIQFEPLLGMATIGLALDVPVVPMHSLLQFFDGRRVECIEDWQLISNFYKTCANRGMFLSLSSVTSNMPGGASSPFSPYITSAADEWGSDKGPLRECVGGGANHAGEKKTSHEILSALCKKLYALNEKVLNASAHCKQEASFMRCLQSLTRPYDVRAFVGGMSKFSDMRSQATMAQSPRAHDFPDGPVTGGVGAAAAAAGAGAAASAGIDPVLVVAPRSGDTYCIGVHVPSILFWFSAMGRPRRDNGIVVETAHTLVSLAMRTIPKSVFPYEVVPTTR